MKRGGGGWLGDVLGDPTQAPPRLLQCAGVTSWRPYGSVPCDAPAGASASCPQKSQRSSSSVILSGVAPPAEGHVGVQGVGQSVQDTLPLLRLSCAVSHSCTAVRHPAWTVVPGSEKPAFLILYQHPIKLFLHGVIVH